MIGSLGFGKAPCRGAENAGGDYKILFYTLCYMGTYSN